MYHIGNDGQKDEWKYLDKNILISMMHMLPSLCVFSLW